MSESLKECGVGLLHLETGEYPSGELYRKLLTVVPLDPTAQQAIANGTKLSYYSLK